MKRFTILMALTLLMLLSACSFVANKIQGSDSSNSNETTTTTDIGTRPVFDGANREKPQVLFEGFPWIYYSVALDDNGFYVYSTTNDDLDYKFYYCNIKNGSISAPRFTVPEDIFVKCYGTSDDGSLYVAGSVVEGEGIKIYKLSENKSQLILETADVTYLGNNAEMVIDSTNELIYTISESEKSTKVVAYSLMDDFKFDIDTGSHKIDHLILSKSNNQLYMITYNSEEANANVLAYNKTSNAIAEVAQLSNYDYVTQSNTDGFFVTQNLKTLHFNTETNEFDVVSDLLTSGGGDVMELLLTFDYGEKYISLINDFELNSKFILYSPIDEYKGGNETIKLATIEVTGDQTLNAIISDFNFLYPQYSIELENYSQYGDEAETQLILDLINGNGPDIFLLYGFDTENCLPIQKFIANGVLVDLAPYMERDLNFDDYWSNALKALYTDNSCYVVTPTFSFRAIAGTNSALNEIEKLNFSEFITYLETDFKQSEPKFASYEARTKEYFLLDMIVTNLKEFIDYNDCTAYFDTDVFKTLLSTANNLPPFTFIEGDFLNNEKTAVMTPISSLGDYSDYAIGLNGDFSITGYPGAQANITMTPEYLFGVSATTSNIEGAWAFLRHLYEYDDWDVTYSRFTMNKSTFEPMAREFINEKQNMPIEEWNIGLNENLLIPQISDDKLELIPEHIKNMIENINSVYFYDKALENIIKEDLSQFFAGKATAADTARVIQSRVQTYLWEFDKLR